MPDPTIEDDLRHLFACVSNLSTRAYADVRAARDRIAAALKDREHLEEGARLLASDQMVMLDGWDAHHSWLERERARKASKP